MFARDPKPLVSTYICNRYIWIPNSLLTQPSKGALGIIMELPKTASDVLNWWATDPVKDAFPHLARFVLDVIAMLPSTAWNDPLWWHQE